MSENKYEKLAVEASFPTNILNVRFKRTVANSDAYLILSYESQAKKKKYILRNQETGNRNMVLHFMWQQYLESHYKEEIHSRASNKMEAQPLWSLFFLSAWIFLAYLPSIHSGLETPSKPCEPHLDSLCMKRCNDLKCNFKADCSNM